MESLQENPTVGIDALLPLDAPERTIAFRTGEKTYRHTFRRVTADDWNGFFSRIEAEMEQNGRTATQMVNTNVAALWLYSRVVIRAEGYSVRDGRKLEDLPEWRERIPQNHRLHATDVLMKVSVSGRDEGMLEAEGERVELTALWTAGLAGTAMVSFSKLMHYFETPSAEHRRRYLRARSRTTVVGGSRAGKTLIPSAQPLLMKLYDELVTGVGGYSVAGRPLTEKAEIVANMDALHKVCAASELFETRVAEDASEATEAE